MSGQYPARIPLSSTGRTNAEQQVKVPISDATIIEERRYSDFDREYVFDRRELECCRRTVKSPATLTLPLKSHKLLISQGKNPIERIIYRVQP